MIENLDSLVHAIGYDDLPETVDGNPRHGIELAFPGAEGPKGPDELPLVVEHLYPVVMTVRHQNTVFSDGCCHTPGPGELRQVVPALTYLVECSTFVCVFDERAGHYCTFILIKRHRRSRKKQFAGSGRIGIFVIVVVNIKAHWRTGSRT